MVNNKELQEFYDILDKHKKNKTCDLCGKRLWFWQKSIRFVIRTKENVWAEYYHVLCMVKRGYLRKVEKVKSGRWDDRDPQGTSNVVH
jgi:hypothetical protein